MASYLFTVEDSLVRPTTEALLTSPFREIWERDESPKKGHAIREFSYIEFMVSMKGSNPYKNYAEGVKEMKIIEGVFRGEEFAPDELVKAGIAFLQDVQKNGSRTYQYFMSSRAAVKKIQDYFNDFDMNDVNERTGNPLWKPKDITNALKDTDDVSGKLDKLEKKVEEELFDVVVTKANKEISQFADPDLM